VKQDQGTQGSAFVRNSALGVVAGLSTSAAGFASGVIVARALGVNGSGSIAMALWILFVAVTLSDCGITGTLARFLSGAQSESQGRAIATWLVRILWMAILFGLAGLTLIMLWWLPTTSDLALNAGQHLPFFLTILLLFVIQMASSFGYHYLRGTHRFGRMAQLMLIGSIGQIPAVLIGSLLYGVAGALVGYILGSLPVALFAFRLPLAGKAPPAPERARMRTYAGSLWIAGLLSPLLWTRIDLLLVERLQGLHATGLFTAAASICALLIQLAMMICSALLPHLSSCKPSERTAASSATLKLALMLLLPMAFGTAAIARRLIPLVYGPDFAVAGFAGSLLALAAAGSVITIAASNVLNMLEQNGKLVFGGLAGAVINVLMGLWLIPFFGIVGAGVARLVPQVLIAALTIKQVNGLQPGTITTRWLAPILFASTCCAIGADLTMRVLPSDFGMFVAVAVGGLVYIATCLLLVPFDEADLDLLRLKGSTRTHGIGGFLQKGALFMSRRNGHPMAYKHR
jgi:O-antigen/teichoic acid export membrane protein